MGLLGQLKRMDINAGARASAETQGACLLDVRDEGEYLQGHVPGSRNTPIPQLEQLVMALPLNAPLFVYGETDERASIAAKRIRLMGFSDITDLGSIDGYDGQLE